MPVNGAPAPGAVRSSAERLSGMDPVKEDVPEAAADESDDADEYPGKNDHGRTLKRVLLQRKHHAIAKQDEDGESAIIDSPPLVVSGA